MSAVPEWTLLIQLSWRRLLLPAGTSALLDSPEEAQYSSAPTSTHTKKHNKPWGRKWNFEEIKSSRLVPRCITELLLPRASGVPPGAEVAFKAPVGVRLSRRPRCLRGVPTRSRDSPELSFWLESQGANRSPFCLGGFWGACCGATTATAWWKGLVAATGKNTCSSSVSPANSTAARSSSN